jgi:hypothetical protein
MGPVCPSTVQFTCTGQDIPVLIWFIGEVDAVYFPQSGGENVLPINVEYGSDLGPVHITSVQFSLISDGINVTSTFTANATILEGLSNIQCGSRSVRSNLMIVNVSVLGKYTLW